MAFSADFKAKVAVSAIRGDGTMAELASEPQAGPPPDAEDGPGGSCSSAEHVTAPSMDAAFCVEALQEAIGQYGCPSIFNTDQGSQFTSTDRIDELKANNIDISMDSKGRWMDNVFIERLWRSLKYECVYLNAFDDMKDAEKNISYWMDYYNHKRPHSSLNDQTPNEIYEGIKPLSLAA